MVRSPRKKPKGVLPEPPRKQWGKQWGGWKLVFTGVAMVVVIGLLVLSSVQSQSPSTVPIAQQPVSSPAASAPVTRTELVRVDLRPVETLEDRRAAEPAGPPTRGAPSLLWYMEVLVLACGSLGVDGLAW